MRVAWDDTALSEAVAIVLAAGKSTRMKSDLPKVLHEVCGAPMLRFSLGECRLTGVGRLLVVVGHGRERVIQSFGGETDIEWVEQTHPLGTGDAVLKCRDALKDYDGSVLVLAGDMPLIRRETLARLVEVRENAGYAAAMATTVLEDPTGYGRIVRNAAGELEAIVEHKDCSLEQLEIDEVNPSYYCFDARKLFSALEGVLPSGSKGEYYLTDVIRLFRERGYSVSAEVHAPPSEAMGVNSRLDLAAVNRIMQDRIQLSVMEDGVTIVDPDNTWIEADAAMGRDTVLYPFSMVRRHASIGDRCRIGPFAVVGSGQVVKDGSTIGPTVSNGAAV